MLKFHEIESFELPPLTIRGIIDYFTTTVSIPEGASWYVFLNDPVRPDHAPRRVGYIPLDQWLTEIEADPVLRTALNTATLTFHDYPWSYAIGVEGQVEYQMLTIPLKMKIWLRLGRPKT